MAALFTTIAVAAERANLPKSTDGSITVVVAKKIITKDTSWSPWWKAGIQIHVHTNGNGGNQATLEALEGLMREEPCWNHRFAFQHFGMSTPEQARGIASVGGTVSVNPYYLYSRAEFNAPMSAATGRIRRRC